MNTPLEDEKTKITDYGVEGVELLAAAFIHQNWVEFTAWAESHTINHAGCADWVRMHVGDQQRLVGPGETVAGQDALPCPVS